MADKAAKELERIYTIPLREVKTSPRNHRTDRAVRAVKSYLSRHMKSEEIWIDRAVNEKLWERGMYQIPSKIRVRALKFDDGVVEVTLPETDVTTSIRAEMAEAREKREEEKAKKSEAKEKKAEKAEEKKEASAEGKEEGAAKKDAAAAKPKAEAGSEKKAEPKTEKPAAPKKEEPKAEKPAPKTGGEKTSGAKAASGTSTKKE